MPAQVVLKLGTAVKIQTVLDQNNPTSVTILIEDQYGNIKVNYLAMSQVAPNVYQYVWQSTETNDTDSPGEYVVTIKAVKDGYTSVEQTDFELEDID